MKFLRILPLLVLLLLVGCSDGPDVDAEFVHLADGYLDRMYALNPEWATNLGDHRFDDRVSDLSAAGFAARVEFNRTYLDSLNALDQTKLSQVNRIDCEILRDHCEAVIFRIEEIREHTWNPTFYNPGDGLYNILARDYAPLPERLAALKSRLEQLPAALAAARANLHHPPRVMTETAIRQNPGVINLVMDGLTPYLDQAPALKDAFAPVRARAIAALDDYGRWLKTDLLPNSTGNFRLGRDLWRRKLKYSLNSDLTPEEILAAAERDLAATRSEMYTVALPLYREFFRGHADDPSITEDKVIRLVLSRLADDRPTNETIVQQAERDLARLTDFVRDHDLVTVPDDPVELIVMPEHQRGVAIGYCDSPGPLEQSGTTFYAISPTPKDWSPARAETFYREYNDYMLQNLTIHEAMPGHYLQIALANRFTAPTPLRAIFSSGTFVEGWATYAEQLMVETGHGGPQVHMQQLKMKLRLIINAIIDQKIHTGNMTEGEAMQMMMVEGFQEEGEAAGKWIRACVTSAQLSTYYVGNLELNGLRTDYEAKAGGGYSHREFHDQLLGFGSPAPRYVRELMGL